jgi:hypothetical protein
VFLHRDTTLVPARTAAVKRCAWLPVVFLPLLMQSAPAATPAKIDLNAFDALKKSVPLPNSSPKIDLSSSVPGLVC